MVFINDSGFMYNFMVDLNTMTGSLFATLLLIVIVLIAIALVLRIPLEFTALFVLPILIVSFSYYSDILSVLGVFAIYIGLLLAKNFFFE